MENFSDFFLVACVFSQTPKVCACFVVAWRSVIFRTSPLSTITFVTKVEPLLVINVIGRFVWSRCLW